MRLFFALWPPMEATERLVGIAQSAADQFGGKPTRQETIHLTLAFLGEVAEERLPLLIQSATSVRATSFELDIDRLGYWNHNHLLWAGSTLPCAALIELVNALQNALIEAGFTVDGGKRVFNPHISLVRKIPEAGSPGQLPSIEPIRWPCSSFVLVRSRLSDAGPLYETISDFPLNRPARQ